MRTSVALIAASATLTSGVLMSTTASSNASAGQTAGAVTDWGLPCDASALIEEPAVALVRPLSSQPLAEQRARYGFPVDSSTIATLLAQSEVLPFVYGMPVMPAEACELQARDDTAVEGAALASTLGEEYSATFAGGWMDPETGDIIYSFTGPLDHSPSAQAIQRRVRTQSHVEVRSAAYSEAQLREWQERVLDPKVGIRAYGVALVATSRPAKDDRLELMVSSDIGAAADVVTSQLGIPGDAVVVRGGAVGTDDLNRDFRTGAANGGQWMGFSNGNDCTIGIANASSNSTGNFYVVTAGHCAPRGVTAYLGLGTSPIVGAVQKNYLYDGSPYYNQAGTLRSNCDCATVGPFSPNSAFRLQYVRVDNNGLYKYTAIGNHDNSYFEGRTVCLSGAASFTNNHPGTVEWSTIEDPTSSKSAEGTDLVDLVRVKGELSESGDSGGPWGSGGNYLGVNQGRISYYFRTDSIFSKTSALASMNVSLVW